MNLKLKKLLTVIDEHSVEELRPSVYLGIVCLSLSVCISILSYFLLLSEVGTSSGIQNYRDSLWTVLMSMTTIGFGDFYPVTNWGRVIVFTSFIIGAIHLGFVIQECSKIFGSDNSIKNRVLMTQLCEVMRKLEYLEEKAGHTIVVDENSHLLDAVFWQTNYESETLYEGWLTAGRDSSGMHILAIEAKRRVDDTIYSRWIPAKDKKDLANKFIRYQDYNLL